MPRNPHRPGASAANSFRADEVAALDQLLRALQRGAHPADLRHLLAAEPMRRAAAKITRMHARIEMRRALGITAIDGGRK